jgi:hypothetical protein
MHGGFCGQNFKDVHDTLDKTKLHHKDANEINPIATVCLPCYHHLLLTKIITSPAPANLAGSKQKATEDNAKPAPKRAKPAPKKNRKTRVQLTNQQKLENKYQRNRRPAIRHQSKHSLTNKVMKAISMISCFYYIISAFHCQYRYSTTTCVYYVQS